MTGGQDLPAGVDFEAMALASGIHNGGTDGTGKVERLETLEAFEAALPRLLTEPGPHFIVIPVTNSHPLPPVNHTDHAGRVTKLRTALGIG
jgi:thiamine pyrophosphate-dependent acetolactate synthase large subunit-like protein